VKPDLANRDHAFSIGLALAALVPRLYVALAWAREPVWDGHYYHFGATRIAAGLGYSEDVLVGGQLKWSPWCHYPVGYSGFLGIFYKFLGTGLWVAPVLNACIGALTVWVVHRLARMYLSHTRARIAALLCAVHPGLLLYTGVVMSEPLAAFSMALCGYLAARYRSRWYGIVLAGGVLGLSVLVRPTGLFVIPLLALVFGGPSLRDIVMRGVPRAALAGLVTLAVVSPWTLRNCRVMDGCALVSTNGGWNLAIGVISDTGRFDSLHASDGCPVVTGQVQQDKCWAEVGKRRILENPGRWLGLIPLKLRHTYNHESFAPGYLGEANPESWPEARRAWWREKMTIFHHLLMLGSTLAAFGWVRPRSARDARFWVQAAGLLGVFLFLGLALRAAEPPLFWMITWAPVVVFMGLPGAPPQAPVGRFLFGLVLMTTLTHAVFFGDDRYHLTISPMLCILAAAALRVSKPTPAADAAWLDAVGGAR
jgi:Dolichyl-phosphate-mannose-protein mannosyltransferase